MSTSDNSSQVCVVCGAGDTGICVIRELVNHGFTVTVVDIDADALKSIGNLGITVTEVQGNCLIDNILKKSDLLDARALFCVLPDDRSNVFLSLSARRINPELEIYSVASDISAERKLKLVGTRRTVNKDAAEGLMISNEMLRPNVAKFLDGIVFARDKTEGYISIEIDKECPSIGKTLKKLELRNRTGVVIIAVKKIDGSYIYSPSGDYRLAAGDNLICFGTGDDGKAIENLLAIQQDKKEKWGSLRHLFGK